MQTEYLRDDQVTPELDSQLRELLCTCFTGEQDEVFRTQRFAKEMPVHRYLAWEDGKLAAHVAVHEKRVKTGGRLVPICGIAEVCVHPDARGQGLVKELLEQVHADAKERGDVWSVLFGEMEVYQSAGYRPVNNLVMISDEGKTVQLGDAMVCMFGTVWPCAVVELEGIPF